MYDVIVVGARVAGSSLARLLAQRGARVLLVDRARFPSDTLNGHYIQAAGTRYLARWGLLDRVLTDAAAPVRRHRLQFGPVELEGQLAWPDGEPAVGLAPRRHRLDALLLAAAAEAGVEVREAFPVLELVWEDDRVVGIRGRKRRGARTPRCRRRRLPLDGRVRGRRGNVRRPARSHVRLLQPLGRTGIRTRSSCSWLPVEPLSRFRPTMD